MCPACGKSVAGCKCGKKKTKETASPYPNDGTVRIRREVKGRKGKTVTAIFGVPYDGEKLKSFATTLKQCCGAGGSVKDGIVTIQGDHRKILLNEIKKHGFTVKIAGG